MPPGSVIFQKAARLQTGEKFENGIRSILNFELLDMIKNYLKIAWRNLIQNKFSSFINIGGLAVGMAVVMLIAFWMYDELSFNKYNENYSRIARVMRQETWKGKTSTGPYNPLPVSGELRTSFADNFEHVAASTFIDEHTLAYDKNKFNHPGIYMERDSITLLKSV